MFIEQEMQLLTIKDICDVLKIKKNCALRLVHESIPYITIGNRIRVRPSDLDTYIEQNLIY